MPSLLHETLIELFRVRTTLAPELLKRVFGIDLPACHRVRVEDATLNLIVPAEYRAELVLALEQAGNPAFGIVLEVQLGIDPRKEYAWIYYLSAFRIRTRCPVAVLVVTPNSEVAAWAAQPMPTGPCATFTPIVLGPGAIPRVTDAASAQVAPEAAVLSALAHGNAPDGLKAVLTAIQGLDEMTTRSCTTIS